MRAFCLSVVFLMGCTMESPTQIIIIDGSCNTEVVTADVSDPGLNATDDVPICENNS